MKFSPFLEHAFKIDDCFSQGSTFIVNATCILVVLNTLTILWNGVLRTLDIHFGFQVRGVIYRVGPTRFGSVSSAPKTLEKYKNKYVVKFFTIVGFF